MDFFNNPAGTRRSARHSAHSGGITKVVVALPHELHEVISEITFNERISIKQYVVDAAEGLRIILDATADSNKYQSIPLLGYPCSPNQLRHVSVQMPSDLAELLRDAAHYGKKYGIKSYRHMIIDLLRNHLDTYKSKYPEIIRSIKLRK